MGADIDGVASYDQFGSSVPLSSDGNTVAALGRKTSVKMLSTVVVMIASSNGIESEELIGGDTTLGNNNSKSFILMLS